MCSYERHNEKTDIWAAGILIYEIFYKEAPFKGNTMEEIKFNIKNKDIVYQNLKNIKKDTTSEIKIINQIISEVI